MRAPQSLTLIFIASLLMAGCSPSGLGGSSGPGGGDGPIGGDGGGPITGTYKHPGVNAMRLQQRPLGSWDHAPVAATAALSGNQNPLHFPNLVPEEQDPDPSLLSFKVGGHEYKLAGTYAGPYSGDPYYQVWDFQNKPPEKTTVPDGSGGEKEVWAYPVAADEAASVIKGQHSLVAIAFTDRTIAEKFYAGERVEGSGYLILDGNRTDPNSLPKQIVKYDGIWALSTGFLRYNQTDCDDCMAGTFEGEVDFNQSRFEFDLTSAPGAPLTTGTAFGSLGQNGFAGYLNTSGAFNSRNDLSGYFYGPNGEEMNGIVDGRMEQTGDSTHGVLLGQQN